MNTAQIATLLILFLLFMVESYAQPVEIRKKQFNLDANVALEGYDPVSYHTHKPEEGSRKRAYTYRGITYWFSSMTNLTTFKNDPDQYEPGYGGWCAFAMGDSGEKVKIDPKTYKIINGKLYLFYNFWFNNTLEDWNENEKILKEKADRYWSNWIKK